MKVDHRNRPPKVIGLYGGRCRVERLADVTSFLDTKTEIDADVFLAPKTADKTITTCFIVEQALIGADTGKPNQLKQVFETLTSSLVDSERPRIDFELNGLRRITTPRVAFPDVAWEAGLIVGTTAYPTSGEILSGIKDDSDHLATRLTLTWIEPGIIEAEKKFDADAGVLFVTFQSVGAKFTPTCLHAPAVITGDPIVAFQGGAAAVLVSDRTRNVNGLRTFVVTVMMKADGSALSITEDNTVHSFQKYVRQQRPGEINVTSADGIVATPGAERWALVLVEEVLSAVGTLDAAYKPYSVKSWANANLRYKPTDGTAHVSISKGAHGYLAGGGFSGSPGTVMGIPVTVAVGTTSSDPSASAFMALDNQVLGSENGPAFITDTGQKWYRKRRITMVGTFATNLN